jgi:RNA polymerase sigma-70 factor (ECF subfamily)
VSAAREAVEQAARQSYGRLVAYLASRSGDLAAAEDALADAFESALRSWPRDGVPQRADAWLLTAARRRLIDGARHHKVREAHRTLIEQELYELMPTSLSHETEFPDERLKLLFVCAHPAIDPGARTPLMLQTVLGLDAATIAAAFLAAPSAMGQRLVRAKTKIRDAGIAFQVPPLAELPERLDAVLAAIYAAYGTGWDAAGGAETRHAGLAAEAIQLARVLLSLMPDQPEALGLLALMLFCESRRAARLDAQGRYVPLAEQDTALWSAPMIDEAQALLRSAHTAGAPGRFQFEAAIQSLHAQRRETGRTRWDLIADLYEGLVQLAPTIGACVGRAAATGEAAGAAAGLALLDAMPQDEIAQYQPWWAVRAHLLAALHRHAEARNHYERAAGLSDSPATRRWLLQRAASPERH